MDKELLGRVLELKAAGMSTRQIAKELNISKSRAGFLAKYGALQAVATTASAEPPGGEGGEPQEPPITSRVPSLTSVKLGDNPAVQEALGERVKTELAGETQRLKRLEDMEGEERLLKARAEAAREESRRLELAIGQARISALGQAEGGSGVVEQIEELRAELFRAERERAAAEGELREARLRGELGAISAKLDSLAGRSEGQWGAVNNAISSFKDMAQMVVTSWGPPPGVPNPAQHLGGPVPLSTGDSWGGHF